MVLSNGYQGKGPFGGGGAGDQNHDPVNHYATSPALWIWLFWYAIDREQIGLFLWKYIYTSLGSCGSLWTRVKT